MTLADLRTAIALARLQGSGPMATLGVYPAEAAQLCAELEECALWADMTRGALYQHMADGGVTVLGVLVHVLPALGYGARRGK